MSLLSLIRPRQLFQAPHLPPRPVFAGGLALSLLLLGGCAPLGPNFQRPALPGQAVAAKKSAPPATAMSALSAPVESAESDLHEPAGQGMPASPWWLGFQDDNLNRLQERLNRQSLDWRLASLRVAQSRQALAIISSQTGPHADARSAAGRQQSSEAGPETRLVRAIGGSNTPKLLDLLGQPFSVFSVGFDAGWELDLWGRTQRSVETAEAQWQASQALARQAGLSLQAELSRAFFSWQAAVRRQSLLEQQVALTTELLALQQAQARHGLLAPDDSLVTQSSLRALQAARQAGAARVAAWANQISQLLGERPGEVPGEAPGEATRLPGWQAAIGPNAAQISEHSWNLPEPLATFAAGQAGGEAQARAENFAPSLPGESVRQRPDVQAAEARLHAATAEIGVAMADLYPRISLGLSAGFQSLHASQLSDWDSRSWQIGPVLNVPLFDHGRRRATVALRQLQQQEAAIQFQQTVLKAWQETDDALRNLAAQAEWLRSQTDQAKLAAQTLASARARQAHGLVPATAVINAERQSLEKQADLADALAQWRISAVALVKAAALDQTN